MMLPLKYKVAFQILLKSEEPDLVRAVLKSRHIGAKKYTIWVQFKEDGATPQEKIPGWVCSCKCGLRTLGCCAHIASVIWYLAYARHNGWVPNKPSWSAHILDTRDLIGVPDDAESDGDLSDGDIVAAENTESRLRSRSKRSKP